MKNYSTDIMIILFFLLGCIAGSVLDRFAVKMQKPTPKNTQCKIVQNQNAHWFDCEVFNDYAAIKM
jgi:hypothetical protein